MLPKIFHLGIFKKKQKQKAFSHHSLLKQVIKPKMVTLWPLSLFFPEDPHMTSVLPCTQREGMLHKDTKKNLNRQTC